jgi:hypothetical protein
MEDEGKVPEKKKVTKEQKKFFYSIFPGNGP